MNKALRELLFSVDKLWPPRLGRMAAWYDSLDQSTLLAGNGTQITDGGAVALWGDKSGNSGVNCLVLTGATGNYASTPDATALDVGANFVLIFDGALDDWTPATNNHLITKWGSTANQRTFLYNVETNGRLRIGIDSGGAGVTTTFLTSTADVTSLVANYGRLSVRVDYVGATASATFYTAPTSDGPWTQLGDVVIGTARTPYVGTAQVQIGAVDGTSSFTGKCYRAKVIDGTFAAGTTVLDIDFSTAGKKVANGDTFVCATGQTVTLNSSGATGARISGERDLFQGTAANRPVYLAYSGTKYGYLNGATGTYFSTPDSAAVSVTGDIQIVAHVQALDWTPAANSSIVAKWSSAGTAKRSYILLLTTTGALLFSTTVSGGTQVVATSTATISAPDNSALWVKVVRDVDNGSGGNTTTFYTSSDGVSWTLLGDPVVNSGTTSIQDTDYSVEVGSEQAGAASLFAGRIYRAQIYNGIGGTLVADFNPALYTSGTTFTASTGEVWTVNGGAHIVTRTGLYFDGSNDYLKTAAFSLSQPETVYGTLSQIAWTTGRAIIDGGASGTLRLYQSVSSPGLYLSAGADLQLATDNGLPLKTTGAISEVFNGDNSSIRKNRTSATTGAGGSNNALGFTVGSRGDGTSSANAFVSEVAIYGANHGASIQDRVARYAGRKWGFNP